MFLLISTMLFFSQFFGLKAALEVTLIDYKFEYYDLDYFKDIETSIWGNDIFINLTIIDFLPVESELRIQVIGATMGEYKVSTGIDSTWPLCNAMKEPIFVGLTLQYFVPPIEDCPPKLGTYIVDANFDDTSTMPDNFPPNNYLIVTTVYTPEKKYLEIHCYLSTR